MKWSLSEKPSQTHPDDTKSFGRKVVIKRKPKYPPEVEHSPWKLMVGRLLSFWDGIFSGALLNFQVVHWNSWKKKNVRIVQYIPNLMAAFHKKHHKEERKDLTQPNLNSSQKMLFGLPSTQTKQQSNISSWWFQPIWKILIKMGIFPK